MQVFYTRNAGQKGGPSPAAGYGEGVPDRQVGEAMQITAPTEHRAGVRPTDNSAQMLQLRGQDTGLILPGRGGPGLC